jgi:hypothetical protein
MHRFAKSDAICTESATVRNALRRILPRGINCLALKQLVIYPQPEFLRIRTFMPLKLFGHSLSDCMVPLRRAKSEDLYAARPLSLALSG